ncbi:TrmB family transcriptional regulator [Ktedonobacter racemifer]|uniref:Transcriptional regulator, TrmB n=1 Tax=Ktedonobacter racemifer DSM 44963 TaxID=485913 RepID=D6TBQ7_KTERA|nr:helix-turn-helix domain-containing protein [Ktedonobacter racemifer]EFH89839.1 transcriptional regulator, TrmB [Ktedonobacter racemifer DSM 44963]
MDTLQLLQQIGLTKYEAEAYATLVQYDSMTGYELGKQSHVPLSRIYEIIERLVEKGLVLVQPGEPPRYRAQEPEYFLGQVRATMEHTLNTLAASLTLLHSRQPNDEFWVVRGQRATLERVHRLLGEAREDVDLVMPATYLAEMQEDLWQAQERGCRVYQASTTTMSTPDSVLVLCDRCLALVGTLSSQAIVTSNPALTLTLRGYFEHQRLTNDNARSNVVLPERGTAWLVWEERKQRLLWNVKNASSRATQR